MKKIFFIFILLGLNSAMAMVFFDEPIQIKGQCDEKVVSATIAPDARSLSILFADNLFLEQIPGVTKNQRIEKKCIFKIPLNVKPDEFYEVLGFDWRGFVALPKKSMSTMRSRIWISHDIVKQNGKTQTFTDSFVSKNLMYFGQDFNDIYLHQNISEPKNVTECGMNYLITIEVSLSLYNSNTLSNAQIGLDSLDAGQTASNIFVKKKCKNPHNTI